jgi:hypothetical protein
LGIDADTVAFSAGTLDHRWAMLVVWDNNKFGNGILGTISGEVTFTSLWGTGPDELYVSLGQVGWVYHYLHMARTFDHVTAPCATPLAALWGYDTGTSRGLWAFGDHGLVLTRKLQ